MSGFEIAGIVLGAVPIVIEIVRAAKGVLSGDSQRVVGRLALRIQTTKLFYAKQFEGLLPVACSNFADLQRTHIERLAKDRADKVQSGTTEGGIDASDGQLDPPAADDGEMNVLISLLNEAAVRAQLKQHLGDEVYGVLEQHVDEFGEQLSNVCTTFKKLLPKDVASLAQTEHVAKLKALLQSHFKLSPPKSVIPFMRTVSVLTVRKKRKLEEMVDELEELEKRVDRLLRVPSRVNAITVLTTDALLQGFELVRTSALWLYSEIGRLFTGSCHAYHTSHLYLEDRHKGSDLDNPRFRVSLLCPDRSGRHTVLHSGTIDANFQMPGSVQISLQDNEGHQEQVKNLCSDIQRGARTGESVQLSLSNGQLRYGPTIDTYGHILSASTTDIDLATILERWKRSSRQKREIPRPLDRIHIALHVASSFLQLNRTGWGITALQTRGIRLQAQIHVDGDDELYVLPEARRPFVRFVPERPENETSGDSNLPLALTSLAIILLEIYLLKPLATWIEQCGQEQAARDQLALAKAWAEDERYMIPHDYHEAISFCLAEASLPYRTWTDTPVLQGFVLRVIEPLRELCSS